MGLRDAAKWLLPLAWTAAPMYGFERLADQYYLSSNPAFYTISGIRLEVFLASALLGSAGAGVLLGKFRAAVATQVGAVVSVILAVYALCDPRVCFSTGIDGLEPLRLGILLGSVAVCGAAMGTRGAGRNVSRLEGGLTLVSGFVALAFFPVMFDFAGTALLPPLHPWAVAALLLLVSYSVSVASSIALGWRAGILLPFASLTLLLVMATGLASAYLPAVMFDVFVMCLAVATGAAGGTITGGVRKKTARSPSSGTRMVWVASILLVMLMTLVVIPDAVNGVLPSSDSSPSMGVPVYDGAYQDTALGHSDTAGVLVDFTGTNASSIQQDNFLAAGIGIHSAGCCVDGIDYSYRFDVYLFHSGNESLVASGWEVCDDNLACGGHSWKVLLLAHEQPIGSEASNGVASLRMAWAGGRIVWSYSTGAGRPINFTSFAVPPQQNHDFNTGVASGGSLTSEQSAAYFFQFGIMSRYPIGHGGWEVTLHCPSTGRGGSWECVQHARTVRGDQSFWKVLWRWGEDYPNVSESSTGPWVVVFEYSSASTDSFQELW